MECNVSWEVDISKSYMLTDPPNFNPIFNVLFEDSSGTNNNNYYREYGNSNNNILLKGEAVSDGSGIFKGSFTSILNGALENGINGGEHLSLVFLSCPNMRYVANINLNGYIKVTPQN